jgi:hypothetical protein
MEDLYPESRIPDLARQFGDATLLNVRQGRDQRTGHCIMFTMRVNRVVEDESLYTPEESRRIIGIPRTIN